MLQVKEEPEEIILDIRILPNNRNEENSAGKLVEEVKTINYDPNDTKGTLHASSRTSHHQRNTKFSFNCRSHTSKQYFCGPCDIKFPSKRKFQVHMDENHPRSKVKREVTRMDIPYSGCPTTFSEFQCKICLRYFTSKYSLKDHIEHHYQPEHKCEKCGKVFQKKFYFDKHKLICGSIICEHCERKFSSMKYLIEHMKTAHNIQIIPDGLFLCHFCGKSYENEKFLQIHVRTKKCRIKLEFTCDHCGKIYNRKAEMKLHVQMHVKTLVECKVCKAKMKPILLQRHMKMTHGNKLECEVCGLLLKNVDTLRRHRKCHDPRFECEICYKKFPQQSSLKYHMDSHDESKKYKCQICGLETKAKNYLRMHIKRHDKDQKRFKCDRCDFRAYSNFVLVCHLKYHEKLDEMLKLPNAIKCEKCFKVLMGKTQLRTHLRNVHRDFSMFQCDFCGKMLKFKWNLKNHMEKRHMYGCEEVSKYFEVTLLD